ncbi:hypothetical protein [uncultured Tateyamaria sp.]|uniref:calcium-binding protein n=1 Tax=uncultured Tateyamaria sp. TaxID=455651 RepID=UPI002601BCAA|nr:hypothetical protein [uncultured Tateyamaria sp.]
MSKTYRLNQSLVSRQKIVMVPDASRPIANGFLSKVSKRKELMLSYTIVENEQFADQIVTPGLLGANFVTSFDFELADSTALLDTLQSMSISTLRFPGGSVTEDSFAEASFLTGNWDATSHFDGRQTQTLTPLNSFFEAAGYIGADVQLVIPTRVAFTQSAGEALQAGEFGTRTELRSDYLDMVDRYMSEAMALAAEAGTQITHVEIGNEFWGSGEMSSAEYGLLAGILTAHLSTEYPDIEVFIQIVSSSNTFTPNLDEVAYLESDGNGDFNIYPDRHISDPPEDHWVEVTISGIGNSHSSNQIIAENFASVPGAVSNLSGVINHVYFGHGFDGIDGERDFALQTAFDWFIDALGAPVELDYLISEWSPRGPNSNGLQYAHTVIESFFELVSNGIDYANFWPTTFANPSTLARSLIDSVEGDLTFGGVAFQFLSQAEGMRPMFDFEVDDVVDLHGYAGEDGMTIYAAERSGVASTTPIELSLANFTVSDNYFVTYTHLTSDDGQATANSSNPTVTVSSGFMLEGDLLSLDLQPFEVLMIGLQDVTDAGDQINGSVSNDLITGDGGNDTIFGGDGHDTLNGQLDDDLLFGEEGDDALRGGWGNDTLDGGQGADTLFGHFGDDRMLGQAGDDVLFGHDGDDVLLGQMGADHLSGDDGSDLVDGGAGTDSIDGGSGTDTLLGGEGDDTLNGGDGNDILWGGAGADHLDGGDGIDFAQYYATDADLIADLQKSQNNAGAAAGDTYSNIENLHGGTGNDDLRGDASKNTILGGSGNDQIHGRFGNDTLSGGSGNDSLWGGVGSDHLDGGDGFDFAHYYSTDGNLIADLQFAHVNTGAAAGDTYSDIENLHGGGGNDNLRGDAGDNIIVGGGGNDHLHGRLGNDVFIGGEGADYFNFNHNWGQEQINDFENDVDVIVFRDFGFTDANDALHHATQIDDDVLFDFGGGDSLLVLNTEVSQLFDDMIFV